MAVISEYNFYKYHNKMAPEKKNMCMTSSEHPMTSLFDKAKRHKLDILSMEFAEMMDSESKSLRREFHYPKMSDLPERVQKKSGHNADTGTGTGTARVGFFIRRDIPLGRIRRKNDASKSDFDATALFDCISDLDLVDPEEDCVYFAGNSLGLLPRGVKGKLDRELDKWAKQGVFGHRRGEMPWAFCDEVVTERMADLVGARREEVTVMNGLTVHLHLQLISFYRPTLKRHKILLEAHAFPADHYAIESEIRLKGYDPGLSMICLKPREGEELLRHEDILRVISEQGDSIAVIMLPGVQYYTGQLFDMESITAAGHRKGCTVGWDLAHSVGNVEIQLHDWNVDFACWCSYKYMNGGAGGISGFFIHERLFEEAKSYQRLTGWWGHRIDTRFDMTNEMELEEGARGFRISNPSVMLCAPLEACLDVFSLTSMTELRSKSKLLTAYLEYLLTHHFPSPGHANHVAGRPHVRIITPTDPEQRGAQLSVMFSVGVETVFTELTKRGVACDKRMPNVLRLAPAPLYNSFRDVTRFLQLLQEAITAANEL